MNVLMLLIFSIFIKEDSVMFNLGNGNDEGAKKIITKIYDKSEDSQLILD